MNKLNHENRNTFTTIDNTGEGNCMYYAYSISLMHYLRFKQDPELTKRIFTNLNLDERSQRILTKLVDIKKTLDIDTQKIKMIENILGPATRKKAAEAVAEEFKKNPSQSQLLACAIGKIKLELKNFFEDLLLFLKDFELTDDIKEAELFKVADLKDQFKIFTERNKDGIKEEFDSQIKDYLNEKQRTQKKPLSARDIKFHKLTLLDTILEQYAINFFKNEDYKNLQQYSRHLAKNYILGSEETLLSLHRAVQKEKIEGTDVSYEDPINLKILINGQDLAPQELEEIVIENIGNFHWLSKIPNVQIDVNKKYKKEKRELEDKVNLVTTQFPKKNNNKDENRISLIFSLFKARPTLKDSIKQHKREIQKIKQEIKNTALPNNELQEKLDYFKNELFALTEQEKEFKALDKLYHSKAKK